MAAKRTLFLHESELTTSEYTQYNESFNDLVDSHQSSVSVRDVRVWIKGYTATNTVGNANIDKVHQLFLSPAGDVTQRAWGG